MSQFQKWMKLATTEEQQKLARAVGTSRRYLYHLSSGQRRASAEMAGAIEEAALFIRPGKLPLLKRGDLCPACGECPYMRQCKNNKKAI